MPENQTDKYQEAINTYKEAANQQGNVLMTMMNHAKECEGLLNQCYAALEHIPGYEKLVARIAEVLSDPYQK